jgi:hypothetical protein
MVRLRYLRVLFQLADLLFIKGRVNENLLATLSPLDPTNVVDARMALQPYLSGIDLQRNGLTVHMKIHAADKHLEEKMHALFVEPLRIWWAANWEWLFRGYGFFFTFLPPVITIKSEGTSSLLSLADTSQALKDFLEQFQASEVDFPTSIANVPELTPLLPINGHTSQRNIVFITCSKQDKKYLEGLKTHLKFYERKDSLDIWDENKVRPGSRWKEEMETALQRTKIAIVLVSAGFLASEFITEKILPPLLLAAEQDGAIILPVIVGTSSFSETDLANFKPANSVSKPLRTLSLEDKDKIWHEIAGIVRDVLQL